MARHEDTLQPQRQHTLASRTTRQEVKLRPSRMIYLSLEDDIQESWRQQDSPEGKRLPRGRQNRSTNLGLEDDVSVAVRQTD